MTSLLDAVQETETKMVEMSALNHLMSTHVLQQAQQIEHLYDQVQKFSPLHALYFHRELKEVDMLFVFWISSFFNPLMQSLNRRCHFFALFCRRLKPQQT